MSKPWDYHGAQPGHLSEPPDDESGAYQAPEPPGLGEPPNFREPSGSRGTSSAEPPPETTDPPTQKNEPSRDKRSAKSSRKSPSVPVALLAVAFVVATVVFLGLRVVRVSVSESANVGGQPPSAKETDQTQELVPQETNGSPTTLASAPSAIGGDQPDWNDLARSIVFFEVSCGGSSWTGSGTLILDGSYVLTNWHVSGGGECSLRAGFTESFESPPDEFYRAEVVVWDSQLDLAIVGLLDSSGNPAVPPGRKPVLFASSEVKLGDSVKLIGYPGYRSDIDRYTLTLTDGAIAGTESFGQSASYKPTDVRAIDRTYDLWGEYLKHTADQNPGVSGGGAFNLNGELVGVPTAGFSEPDGPTLELMRSVRFAKELANRIK